jgi:hypothetical protein
MAVPSARLRLNRDDFGYGFGASISQEEASDKHRSFICQRAPAALFDQ